MAVAVSVLVVVTVAVTVVMAPDTPAISDRRMEARPIVRWQEIGGVDAPTSPCLRAACTRGCSALAGIAIGAAVVVIGSHPVALSPGGPSPVAGSLRAVQPMQMGA